MILVGALLFATGLTLATSQFTTLALVVLALDDQVSPLVLLVAIVLLMAVGLAMLTAGLADRIRFDPLLPTEPPLKPLN